MPLHPNGATLPFHLAGTGTGVLQTLDVVGTDLTLSAEGHSSLGGTDSAPSPLDLALGALTSCNQVTSQIVARGLGISLGEFTIDVRGELDNSVLAYGADGVSNFDSVTVDIAVETDADAATFDTFTADVARRCPVTQLFERSGVKLTSNWTRRPLAA